MKFPPPGGNHGFSAATRGVDVESKLRSLAAARSPDMTLEILAQVHAERAFVDSRTQSIRRWARLVGGTLIVSVVACATLAMIDAKRWIPGASVEPTPIASVVQSFDDDRQAGAEQLRAAPQQFIALAKCVGRVEVQPKPAVATASQQDASREVVSRVVVRGRVMVEQASKTVSGLTFASLRSPPDSNPDSVRFRSYVSPASFDDRIEQAVSGEYDGFCGPQ